MLTEHVSNELKALFCLSLDGFQTFNANQTKKLVFLSYTGFELSMQ